MIIAGIQLLQHLDLPTVARVLYPGNICLQRKWISAWLQAPGARVQVGMLPAEQRSPTLASLRGIARGALRGISSEQYIDRVRAGW